MNYKIKLEPLKFKGADIVSFNGKKSICIPIEDNDMFVSQKTDAIYLNVKAFPMKKENFGYTHCIKPIVPKEKFNAMTKEEQDAIPFIGHLVEDKWSKDNNGSSSIEQKDSYTARQDNGYKQQEQPKPEKDNFPF